MTMMKFFLFSQNNSGGSFAPPAYYVFIEAATPEEANRLAVEKAEIYFDPKCEIDCPCCGSRWNEVWSDECGTNVPEIYGDTIQKSLKRKDTWHGLTKAESEIGIDYAIVYYADGRIEKFNK